MSVNENATPIRVLHNAAGHLIGPGRSLGAVLVGYLGVRPFCPRPVTAVLEHVGSTAVLLGLVAMAVDMDSLYAAVKALNCVVRNNPTVAREMERLKGYQTLGMLFKRRRHLLNRWVHIAGCHSRESVA